MDIFKAEISEIENLVSVSICMFPFHCALHTSIYVLCTFPCHSLHFHSAPFCPVSVLFSAFSSRPCRLRRCSNLSKAGCRPEYSFLWCSAMARATPIGGSGFLGQGGKNATHYLAAQFWLHRCGGRGVGWADQPSPRGPPLALSCSGLARRVGGARVGIGPTSSRWRCHSHGNEVVDRCCNMPAWRGGINMKRGGTYTTCGGTNVTCLAIAPACSWHRINWAELESWRHDGVVPGG